MFIGTTVRARFLLSGRTSSSPAGAWRRLDVQAAAGELGALAHAHQPETGAQPLDVEANPVIPDRDALQ
jgi:hypothetical protein